MKVLFFGSNYNHTSRECLERLLKEKSLTVLVGIGNLSRGRVFYTFATAVRRYGILMVTKKLSRWAECMVSDLLKRIGLPIRQHCSLQGLAESHQIDYFFVRDINGAECHARVQKFAPHLIVVCSFGQILKPYIITLPKLGCINVHPSILPQYRGPAPAYWILKNKEKLSGVTIHFIDEGIDTGDIILQSHCKINIDETEESLGAKTTALGASMLFEAVELIRQGKVHGKKQDERDATYYSFPRIGRQVKDAGGSSAQYATGGELSADPLGNLCRDISPNFGSRSPNQARVDNESPPKTKSPSRAIPENSRQGNRS